MSNVDPPAFGKLEEGTWARFLVRMAKWASFLNKLPAFPVNSGWQTFASPNLRAQAGTPTAASATVRYIDLAGMVFVEVNVSCTTVGTAAGNILIDMPFTCGSEWATGAGKDILLGPGAILTLQNGAITANIAGTGGATLWASGSQIVIGFFYNRV